MKHKIFLSIAAGLILFSSCGKEFLEQQSPNSISLDQSYQTETDIALAVNGVYQALRSSNCIGEGALTWTDDRSDDINTIDNQSNSGEPFQFTAFALAPVNTYLQNHWSALYTPISRANLVLSQIDKISFADESRKNRYIAEMKFIRALMYFMLVREFGDVPVVTERLLNPEEASALTFRQPREVVYEQIIKDLKDIVASDLPVIQPAAEKGRVSLQAANGLLGKAYLTMGASGVDASRAADHFGQAKIYLEACYAQRTFSQLADIPYADVFDVNNKATNPEIIWQIPYKQGDPKYGSTIARSNQAKGQWINSQSPSTGVGRTPTPDLRKEYESGDLRKDFSITYADDPAVQDYYVTKFRDASAGAGTLGLGGNDWIVMRYADIILNLAEVYMYLNDEAKAITYLDMARNRAGLPGYAAMQADADYTTRYPTLKLAILHERRVELAFEHHRWHDLIRFFSPAELVTYFQQKDQADYNNSPLTNISTKDYYFPVPLNETKLDRERMYQNPGYGE